MSIQLKNCPENDGNDPTLIAAFIPVANQRVALELEPDIWSALGEICEREKCSLSDICEAVLNIRLDYSILSHGVRSFIVNYYRGAASENGHGGASHGQL